MNAILGMSELLAETELTSDQRHYLEIMVANGNALARADQQHPGFGADRKRADANREDRIRSDRISSTRRSRPSGCPPTAKGLELAAHIAPGRAGSIWWATRCVCVRCWSILLGNAIKFTELGQVVLEVDRAPAQAPGVLRFAVADTGIGIPAGQARFDFRELYAGGFIDYANAWRQRVWDSPSRSGWSRMMGGQISLKSVVNQGSKFSFAIHFGLASRRIAPNRAGRDEPRSDIAFWWWTITRSIV